MKVARLPVGLTETESKIFSLLLDVTKQYALPVTLRVAGGWVRDRLLGNASDDIDVALEGTIDGEPVTGASFSGYVTRYQQEHGLETRSVGVVKSNPDQSKHLETATTHIFGEAVDFVNLRSENYADTRIPVVGPGTPLQDAQRRDLTINAMFYNLHTEQVEDFTSGLADLERRVVRTPLCPSVTFHDDPLRLLRCIRFACRLGCEIHPDIVAAARQASVHAALRDKVSRERVGIEFRKMLTGPDPPRCYECFAEFGAEDCVFELFSCDKKGQIKKIRSIATPPDEWRAGVSNVRVLHSLGSGPAPVLRGEFRLEMHLAAMLVALSETPGEPGELDRYLTQLITHGLKLPRKVSEVVMAMITAARKAAPVWADAPATLEEFAAAVRPAGEVGCPVAPSRRTALCEALASAVAEGKTDGKKAKRSRDDAAAQQMVFWEEAVVLSELVACPGSSAPRAAAFVTAVQQAGEADELRFFAGVPQMRPLVRGDEIASELKVKGPQIRTALLEQMRFQFESPSASRDAVLRHLSALPGFA